MSSTHPQQDTTQAPLSLTSDKIPQYSIESSPGASNTFNVYDALEHSRHPSIVHRNLARIREHAQRIRTLIELPGFERGEFRIWRALYFAHGEYLAAIVSQHKTGEIRAIVQRRYGMASGAMANSREGFTDPYIQAEEIAVFLGLDDVEPDSLHWVQQHIAGGKPVIANGPMPPGSVLMNR